MLLQIPAQLSLTIPVAISLVIQIIIPTQDTTTRDHLQHIRHKWVAIVVAHIIQRETIKEANGQIIMDKGRGSTTILEDKDRDRDRDEITTNRIVTLVEMEGTEVPGNGIKLNTEMDDFGDNVIKDKIYNDLMDMDILLSLRGLYKKIFLNICKDILFIINFNYI